jgi:membrane glycosyltransferase
LSALHCAAPAAADLVAGTLCEILLSAVYAPISMLLQSRQVWEILIGRDSGWAAQRRGVASTPWHEVLRRHWLHTLCGGLAVALVWWSSPVLLAWMSPTLLGLLLALPLSKASGSIDAGLALLRLDLLQTPEESLLPQVMALRDRLQSRFRAAVDGADLPALLGDAGQREAHFRYVLTPPAAPRGQPDLDRLTAVAKIAEAHDAGEAISWLNRGELLAVLSESALFEQLLRYRLMLTGRCSRIVAVKRE